MILYFTGTGNTRACALALAKQLGDEALMMPAPWLRQPKSAIIQVPDSRLIVMFPTYCWGVPPVVARLLEHGHFRFKPDTEAWMVTTCGDDIGCTAMQWRTLMTARGFTVREAFSVQMPNTYVSMKGFDVDSPEVEKAKIDAMPARIAQIAQTIAGGKSVSDDVVTGKWAWAKSHIIRPWFNRYKTSASKFWVTEECTNCGLCAARCPLENIIPGNGHPEWGRNCAQCLRCYHLCPHHAIRYDNATDGKGQYRRFLNDKD